MRRSRETKFENMPKLSKLVTAIIEIFRTMHLRNRREKSLVSPHYKIARAAFEDGNGSIHVVDGGCHECRLLMPKFLCVREHKRAQLPEERELATELFRLYSEITYAKRVGAEPFIAGE